MSVKGGSNSRPSAWEADALPTELLAQMTWVTSPLGWLVGPGTCYVSIALSPQTVLERWAHRHNY